MGIKMKNKVEKRNDLNEIRSKYMTMQQLRFFAIYLSKINARDESTRRVRFPLSDFQKIMELGKLNIANIKASTDGLLCQIVHVPTKSGGFQSFQLFKECTVEQDSLGEWYVEIDAHDKALPLFFDFKEKYFTYDLGNILRLGSSNQMRMYEILKQRQHLKQPVIIPLDELRELLGIDPHLYPRFYNFHIRVLDRSQKELADLTDISFTYELVKKNRKVIAISFFIRSNDKQFEEQDIDTYIKSLPDPDPVEDEAVGSLVVDNGIDFSEALPAGMTSEEVEVLRSLALEKIGFMGGLAENELRLYDYLNEKTKLMKAQRKPVENQFSWLRKAVSEDWK